MKIGIRATGLRAQSWKRKFDSHPGLTWLQDTHSSKDFDVWIDLNWDENPNMIREFLENQNTLFILGSNLITIEEALSQQGLAYKGSKLFGMNSFPHLIERDIWEMCNPFQIDVSLLNPLWETLQITSVEWMKSRVGFFTSRVLCMIINEAYFTVQEGTATKNDINTAMKLGTNYPKGPFEYVDLFGIDLVYKQLEALYQDTHDERYKICSLLKSEFLLAHNAKP
jgi:3-hydroxybutyryl-CoA dehydrogenase